MGPTNTDRALWAQHGLAAFQECHSSDDDALTSIGDLITNLLHLARLEYGVTDLEAFAASKARMANMEAEEEEDGI